MLTDWLLASLHHLAVFALFGVFLVEFTLVRPGLAGSAVARLARFDAAYGLLALLVIAAGVARLVWGLKGWDYYSGNHSFWGKMTAFAIVGLLSIPPTIRIARWRKVQAKHVNFEVPAAEIRTVRRFLHAEALFFVLIPLFAAAMARGFGD